MPRSPENANRLVSCRPVRLPEPGFHHRDVGTRRKTESALGKLGECRTCEVSPYPEIQRQSRAPVQRRLRMALCELRTDLCVVLHLPRQLGQRGLVKPDAHHLSRRRTSANTSSAGMSFAVPASIAAIRSRISSSQAASTSGEDHSCSDSRSPSASCARSSGLDSAKFSLPITRVFESAAELTIPLPSQSSAPSGASCARSS